MLHKWKKNTTFISLCSIVGLRPWFWTKTTKKSNDVISLNNSNNDHIEMITYFKNKKNNWKKAKNKKYKMVTTILESVDTIVITGATLVPITLSISGIGLMILLIYSGSLWPCHFATKCYIR